MKKNTRDDLLLRLHAAMETAEREAKALIDEALGAAADDPVDVPSEPGPGVEPIVFGLPGTFLNCRDCENWQFDMPFEGEFKEITGSFTLDVGGPDPDDPDGWHCLFWLQNYAPDRKSWHWEDMLLYCNSRPRSNRMFLQTNAGTGKSPVGEQRSHRFAGLVPDKRYSVTFSYVVGDQVSVRWDGGADYRGALNMDAGVAHPVKSKGLHLQFGTQAGKGRESPTNGWKWSDLKVRVYPAGGAP